LVKLLHAVSHDRERVGWRRAIGFIASSNRERESSDYEHVSRCHQSNPYYERFCCTIRALGRTKARVIVRQKSPDSKTEASKDASIFFLIMVGARFV
jgi:hypothetical protein